MTVGDRIRLFAKTRFKTQVKFAEAVGMAEQAISNLANGHQKPATETLERFAEAGMNINWLLTGEGPMDAPAAAGETTPAPLPKPGSMSSAGIPRADTSQLERVDPDDPLFHGRVYGGPEDLALLRYERILALQERQAAELRRELEELGEAIVRRDG